MSRWHVADDRAGGVRTEQPLSSQEALGMIGILNMIMGEPSPPRQPGRALAGGTISTVCPRGGRSTLAELVKGLGAKDGRRSGRRRLRRRRRRSGRQGGGRHRAVLRVGSVGALRSGLKKPRLITGSGPRVGLERGPRWISGSGCSDHRPGSRSPGRMDPPLLTTSVVGRTPHLVPGRSTRS